MDGAEPGPPEVVRAAEVRVGDEVTEVDTPGGPWYRVLRVDEARGSLLLDDGEMLGVEVDVGDWGSVVLRRPTSER